MNPLLSREIRARFRDGRAFGLLFLLVAGASLFLAFLYDEVATRGATSLATGRGAVSGQQIFTQLAWVQTLGWLLISPALTTSSIAYERERGWFDSLLLAPLSARSIVLGKWISALLFAAILITVTLPLQLLVFFLLGGVAMRQLVLIGLLHASCALCGAAIGIAASAWSPRARTALRTAYGIVFIGFFASLFGAATAGELPFRFLPIFVPNNALWTFLGRTNPVLRSLEISGNLEFQRLGVCLGFLFALTLFFLSVAVVYARRPLQEAPFMQKRRKPVSPAKAKSNRKTRPTHGEIPLATRLRFANPVLDREVRAKFRLRQPPLAVVISEILLAILVAFFYGRTFWWAVFEPKYRPTIWWGLCFTGLIVTMMAASIMGSNGVSREREGGTWESVRLSLLSPDEILRGKVGASLLTCAIFSLPVWPLLLPCVTWNISVPARGVITRFDVAACLSIWLATAWSYTWIGLWLGRKAPRTARASGQTLGILSAFLLLSPFVMRQLKPASADAFLGATHPMFALVYALSINFGSSIASTTGAFCALQGIVGLIIWLLMQRFLRRELRRADESETVS